MSLADEQCRDQDLNHFRGAGTSHQFEHAHEKKSFDDRSKQKESNRIADRVPIIEIKFLRRTLDVCNPAQFADESTERDGVARHDKHEHHFGAASGQE